MPRNAPDSQAPRAKRPRTTTLPESKTASASAAAAAAAHADATTRPVTNQDPARLSDSPIGDYPDIVVPRVRPVEIVVIHPSIRSQEDIPSDTETPERVTDTAPQSLQPLVTATAEQHAETKHDTEVKQPKKPNSQNPPISSAAAPAAAAAAAVTTAAPVPAVNPPTVARSSDEAKLNDAVLEKITCPICVTLITGFIHQCHNGHVACSACMIRINQRCPLCRDTASFSRCLSLEQLRDTITVPCKYSGCLVRLRGTAAWEKHIASCDHNKAKCTNPGCDVVGSEKVVEAHRRQCPLRMVQCPHRHVSIRSTCSIESRMRADSVVDHMKLKHQITFTRLDANDHVCFTVHVNRGQFMVGGRWTNYFCNERGDAVVTRFMLQPPTGDENTSWLVLCVRRVSVEPIFARLGVTRMPSATGFAGHYSSIEHCGVCLYANHQLNFPGPRQSSPDQSVIEITRATMNRMFSTQNSLYPIEFAVHLFIRRPTGAEMDAACMQFGI